MIMTKVVNIHEAKTHLSKLLQQVAMGEDIIIAKAGEPVARLIPYIKQVPRRIPGSAKGKIWISEDFNEPLPEEILDTFDGNS
jgi:prevent-host-death family protein